MFSIQSTYVNIGFLRLKQCFSFNLGVWAWLFVVIFVPLYAQTSLTSSFADRSELAREIKVSFFPVEPQYQVGDNMEFEVIVLNTARTKNFQFKFFNERFQQFIFVVRKDFQEYRVKKFTYHRFELKQGAYDQNFKTISISSKENFGFRVDLQDFFDFNQPGIYHIEGVFYPLGVEMKDYQIAIQPFVFRIYPQAGTVNSIRANQTGIMNEDSSNPVSELNKLQWGRISQGVNNAIVQSPRLVNTPNGVVNDYFKRIELSDYEGYISNLDLAKLLKNSYNSTEEYQRFLGANSYEKRIILEDFKVFLIESLDYTLVENALVKTTIIKDEAEVEAVISIREPYENFRRTVDIQTGAIIDNWIPEPVNRLNKYYYITFGLEKNLGPVDSGNSSGSIEWKIARYDVRVISKTDYMNYRDGKDTQVEPLPALIAEFEGNGLIRRINFPVNEARVENSYLVELRSLARFLISNPSLQLSLTGHTDEVGDDDYNLKLSARRVDAVELILVRSGLDSARIIKSFKGESEPLTPGLNDAQRRLNRRVEIEVFYPNP